MDSGTPFGPRHGNPFRVLLPAEIEFLNHPLHDGAKWLVMQVLESCIALVAPASSGAAHAAPTDAEAMEPLYRWAGVCYPGQSFQSAMDLNIRNARTIRAHWDAGQGGETLRSFADAFIEDAQAALDCLIAAGPVSESRFWQYILNGPEE